MTQLKSTLAGLLLAGAAAASMAAAVIDPATGRSGSFGWTGGLGQIDSIDGAAENTWSIALASDGTIDVSVLDGGTAGDQFALVFDGSVIAWTSSGFNGSGYFFGNFDDLALTAGSHTFSLNVTADCCGSGSITNYAFSSVTFAGVVPAPGTALLAVAPLLLLLTRFKAKGRLRAD